MTVRNHPLATTFLGVDPGRKAGAAVLLAADGVTVLRCWRWKNARLAPPLDGLPLDTLIVVELPDGRQNGQGKIVRTGLDRWFGTFEAAVAPRPVWFRVMACQWRPIVIGIPGDMEREAAKEAAMKWAREHAIGMSVEDLANPDACEAFCIAQFARLWDLKDRPRRFQIKRKAAPRRARRAA